jgi:hypothetical protein
VDCCEDASCSLWDSVGASLVSVGFAIITY